MREWFQLGIYASAVLLGFAMIVWYVYFTWSDCLAENSFLTCLRMLR